MTPEQASAVNAAASLAGQGLNAIAQANINKKTMKWNEKMYAQQRADALMDWERQNQYNSPEAMMERFQKAGLNPNLIYGKGATTEAGPIRSTDIKQWSPKAIESDLGATAGGAINTYFDLQIKEQTLDNLKAQNNAITQNANLNAARILDVLATKDTRQFDLAMKNQLKDISVQYQQEALRKMVTDIDLSLQANERAIMQNNMNMRTGELNLKKTAQDILTSRIQNAKTKQETENLIEAKQNLLNSNTLQQIEIGLRNQGINPNDKLIDRVLGKFLQDIINPSNIEIPEIYYKNGKRYKKGKYFDTPY